MRSTGTSPRWRQFTRDVALRPHVKAHKCTAIAAAQQLVGHDTFTCATPREIVGMAAAGVGAELLLANETVDDTRL